MLFSPQMRQLLIRDAKWAQGVNEVDIIVDQRVVSLQYFIAFRGSQCICINPPPPPPHPPGTYHSQYI